jgi:hypothetical protein
MEQIITLNTVLSQYSETCNMNKIQISAFSHHHYAQDSVVDPTDPI